MRYSQCVVNKAVIKWNDQFPDEKLQWKVFTCFKVKERYFLVQPCVKFAI